VVARLNDVVRAMGYEIDESDLSEVDQYEYYQAQVLKPQSPPEMPAPYVPAPYMPAPPAPPMRPMAPMNPKKGGQKMNPEKRQEILDALRDGKISAAEAMEKLNG
jgi:hypothetical protein